MDWLWTTFSCQNKVYNLGFNLSDLILLLILVRTKSEFFFIPQFHVHETQHWAWSSILERSHLDKHELQSSFSTPPLFKRYICRYSTLLCFLKLICRLNFAENGPYRNKAKAIYTELRSNLIRYCLILFGSIGNLFKAISWFLKQCISFVLQKYST
jgi:hypothetical protein